MSQIIKNIKDSYAHIPYTFKHAIAFYKCEKRLTGKTRFRSMFHDVDKLIMYSIVPFFGSENISKFHKSYSNHHIKTGNDTLSMVIDWECDRFTKPDKQLNAKQTLDKYFPNMKDKINPILEELELI